MQIVTSNIAEHCCHGLTHTFPKTHLQEILKTITKSTHTFTSNYLTNICDSIVVSGYDTGLLFREFSVWSLVRYLCVYFSSHR